VSAFTLALLSFVVAGAFFTEAVVGFGATVLTISFGAQLVPLSVMLPAFIPLNIALSAFVIARNTRHVAVGPLLRTIGPAVSLGALVGLSLTALQGHRGLVVGFAGFVTLVGLSELYRTRAPPPTQPLPRAVSLGLMSLGGLVHGLFGAGGPVIVYAAARLLPERNAFRATLAVVWCALNVALALNHARLGMLNAQSLRTTAVLVPALALGAGLGEWAQGRVSLRVFRVATALLLTAAGLSLALRTLWGRG